MPKHMGLNDRKAYALRAGYLGALRSTAFEATDKEVREFASGIDAFARRAVEGESNEPLDVFLKTAVDSSEQIAKIAQDSNPLNTETTAVIAALRIKTNGIKCAACSKGVICDGKRDVDDAIVRAGGHCISDIRNAFDQARDLTQSTYQAFVDPMRLNVTVDLSTEGLRMRPGLIPGIDLAANAHTFYADEDDSKMTTVTVEIAPLWLNRFTCAAYSYLLLHEVFCHAFQMADSQQPRSNKAG